MSLRHLRVENATRDATVAERVIRAHTRWLRLRGMLGRPEPEVGEGLLLEPSKAVHMFWMKYPLDVAFLDPDGRVVALYPELRPWARSRVHRDARYALELRAGELERLGIEQGDQLTWRELG